jgi:hypothetical protein
MTRDTISPELKKLMRRTQAVADARHAVRLWGSMPTVLPCGSRPWLPRPGASILCSLPLQ